jgi:hypothetical protein
MVAPEQGERFVSGSDHSPRSKLERIRLLPEP